MDKIKAIIIGILTFISSWLGVLAIPMKLLVISNIIDYITGIIATKYRGNKIASYISFKGIVKKVCMWLLVYVGVLVDNLILYSEDYIGINIHFNFVVASLVAVWLLINEIISILENISDIGVEIPSFLLPLVKNLKSQIDKKTGSSDEK